MSELHLRHFKTVTRYSCYPCRNNVSGQGTLYIQPEDNVRPGEGELWRDGDGGGVYVVGEVEEVVVVLGCGGGFPQPGAQFNLISTDFTTDISTDVYIQ